MMRAGHPRSPAGQAICQTSRMTAGSAQHEAEWFTSPQQVNQRRYEALRAYFEDRLSYAQAGARFGYTRWAMINLVREHRAGKLELFAPPRKPGPAPGTAPAKDRARGRVIELRRQGLSSYEISRRLAAEETPLNRTAVAEILAEEGFGRLLRGPEPEASISPATPGRDTQLAGRRGHRLRTLAGPRRTAPGPGCCWPSRTWSPWTCPPWPRRPATPAPASSPPCPGCCPCWRSSSPAPGGSPTSMTCSPTRPPRCSPGWPSCRRNPRSPTTPTGSSHDHQQRVPGRPGHQDDQRRAGHRERGDLRPGLPRRHGVGITLLLC